MRVVAWKDKLVGKDGCSGGAADTDLSHSSKGFGKKPPEGRFGKETSERNCGGGHSAHRVHPTLSRWGAGQ